MTVSLIDNALYEPSIVVQTTHFDELEAFCSRQEVDCERMQSTVALITSPEQYSQLPALFDWLQGMVVLLLEGNYQVSSASIDRIQPQG